MYEAIKNFNQQFAFKPEIINADNLVKTSSFLGVGMGGSAHALMILKTWKPELDITIQRDYGLPEFSPTKYKDKLIILSSYSGNTEEPIDAFQRAKELKLNMAVIAVGGKLLSLAIENKVPYIKIPDTGIQPRSALGFSTMAFLKFIDEGELNKINTLTTTLNPTDNEEEGKMLAKKMKGFVPVIYTSSRNLSLAYIWKIKLNETGKIPTFHNVFPELNHNEMNGFDVVDSTRKLSSNFYFLILKDLADNSKILKRMEVLEKLYKARELKVEVTEVKGENIWHKIFSSLVLADWAAYYTALSYGLEPEQVPMVEEFKKLILE